MVVTRRGLKRSRSIKQNIIRESTFSYIVRRQKNLCYVCKEHMGSGATKEHWLAQALGGTDTWPKGNLKGACNECNLALGSLEVHLKEKLREICLNEGKEVMFRLARQFRRAQAREAFILGLPYKKEKTKK